MADDMAIEILVRVILQCNALPLAKALVNLIVTDRKTIFNSYLNDQWGGAGIIRYDTPSVHEDCRVRLNHIMRLLEDASLFHQKSQGPTPIQPRQKDNQDQS